MIFKLTILLLSSYVSSLVYKETCNPVLKYSKSGAFIDDCQDIYLFCDQSVNNTCNYKGCSNSDYIQGWDINIREFPTRCKNGSFCPDNNSKCTTLFKVEEDCELMRDDECEGSNTICLNKKCITKGVMIGGKCLIESTTFTSYLTGDKEFLQTTIRDNCIIGTYCDDGICIQGKSIKEKCTQDRECITGSCSNEGVCDNGPDVFIKIKPWTWGIAAISVIIFVALVMVLLWFLHRFQSMKEHKKLIQFYDDNEEFSKNTIFKDEDQSTCVDEQSFKSKQSHIYLTTPEFNKK